MVVGAEGSHAHHHCQGSFRFLRARGGGVVGGRGWESQLVWRGDGRALLKEQRSMSPSLHHSRPQANHISLPAAMSGAKEGVRKGQSWQGAGEGLTYLLRLLFHFFQY